jgi:hypothetical protein
MRLTEQEIDLSQANVDELLALFDRVSRSPQLRRASRLRELLLYIGKQSIEKGRTDLHEQEIGCSVFGRPPYYDTSQDNIVRVNATELRKRLESYFATDGAHEPWVLEIPRGGYCAVFSRRNVSATVIPGLPATSQGGLPPHVSASETTPQDPLHSEAAGPASLEAARRRRGQLAMMGVIAVLCVTCVSLFWQNRTLRQQMHGWEASPALRSFWGAFLGNVGETDVVLADTSFALEEDILKTLIPLSDYLNYGYKHLQEGEGISPDTRYALDQVLSRNNGSNSDFRAAQRILMLDPSSSTTHLRFARDYTPEALKRDNVILIGSRKSNPWVDSFQDQLEFTMGYDSAIHQSGVFNLHPKPGELPFYSEPKDPATNVGYGVVAFLPNLGQTGDALIIEGTDSQATEAAGEFVTNEASLAALKRQLNAKTFPYFQVLLKTSRLSGTPFNAQIITLRTSPGRTR